MRPESPSPARRHRWKFYLKYGLFLLFILVVTAEVTLRLMGNGPWEKPDVHFEVRSGDRFFRPDSLLGFRGQPGALDLFLEDTLDFRVTHNAAGFRVTKPAPDTAGKPEIWLFGCSFTHGFGVNDEESWPWRLQKRFPEYDIRNYGMSAYGTLQSWLLFSSLLAEAKRPPGLVVLAYGAFHDQRNTSNRFWRKVLSGRTVAEGLRYPHIRFDERDSLVMGYSRLEYRPFPLMRYSALAHYIEQAYNRSEDHGLRSREVTLRLIGRIVERCREAGTRFLLAGIYRHAGTTRVLAEFAERGVATADMSVDLDVPEARILPSDGHPNGASHAKMAALLAPVMAGLLKE